MTDSFIKLFASILDSTVWCEPVATRVVWITMLAAADRDGVVAMPLPALARRANVTLVEAEAAIECFLAPDPHSRTSAHEGRRIQALTEGAGWRLLNYDAYRERRSAAERREYQRQWDRENRPSGGARSPTKVRQSPTRSDTVRRNPTKAEAEVEAEQDQDQRLSDASHPHPDAGAPGHVVPVATTDDPVVHLAAGFDRFWSTYPKKVGKADALKAWKSRRIGLKADLVERIVADVRERAGRHRPWLDGFAPNPATYIRGERWDDALDTGPPRRTRPENTQDRAGALIAGFLDPPPPGALPHE